MKTNQQNAIDAYNNACFETQRKSLHNLGDWQHRWARYIRCYGPLQVPNKRQRLQAAYALEARDITQFANADMHH